MSTPHVGWTPKECAEPSPRYVTAVLSGANVTMPHKGLAADLADRLEPRAMRARSVNTLWSEERSVLGDSTDIDGVVDRLGVGRSPRGRPGLGARVGRRRCRSDPGSRGQATDRGGTETGARRGVARHARWWMPRCRAARCSLPGRGGGQRHPDRDARRVAPRGGGDRRLGSVRYGLRVGRRPRPCNLPAGSGCRWPRGPTCCSPRRRQASPYGRVSTRLSMRCGPPW